MSVPFGCYSNIAPCRYKNRTFRFNRKTDEMKYGNVEDVFRDKCRAKKMLSGDRSYLLYLFYIWRPIKWCLWQLFKSKIPIGEVYSVFVSRVIDANSDPQALQHFFILIWVHLTFILHAWVIFLIDFSTFI